MAEGGSCHPKAAISGPLSLPADPREALAWRSATCSSEAAASARAVNRRSYHRRSYNDM